MSKLRDDERAKRKTQEANDVLLTIGEEGKKGDAAFKEYAKTEEQVSKAKRDLILNEVDRKRESVTYHRFLSDLLKDRCYHYIDLARFTAGWKINTGANEKGVIMEIKSPDGRMFRSAFAATRDPLLDLNAIDNFAMRADYTIEKIEDGNTSIIQTR